MLGTRVHILHTCTNNIRTYERAVSTARSYFVPLRTFVSNVRKINKSTTKKYEHVIIAAMVFRNHRCDSRIFASRLIYRPRREDAHRSDALSSTRRCDEKHRSDDFNAMKYNQQRRFRESQRLASLRLAYLRRCNICSDANGTHRVAAIKAIAATRSVHYASLQFRY